MAARTCLAGILVLLPRAPAGAEPERVFTLAGGAPDQVMITLGDEVVHAPAIGTAMGRTLAGVLVEPRRNLGSTVARLVERQTRPRESATLERRLCIVWLLGAADPGTGEPGASKRIEIGLTAEGWLLARELDTEDDGLDLARLDETRFDQLAAGWPRFRGVVGQEPAQRPGVVAELPGPYTPSRITLDSDTLRRRMFGTPPTEVAPLDRVLDEERMLVRLPDGYDPGRPAGLIIWISPTPSAEQPLDVFLPALDELGLICASIEDAGNGRELADRFQLVLDCFETVAGRYLVDEERVYLTGMSGGGRSASMLWGCFPEVFTGAVPIVGLNSYDLAPTGTGKFWPRNFIKPNGREWSMLKGHRLAAITGAEDFNATETRVRIDGMERDGLDVMLVDQPGLGHEMPSAEVFAGALSWVDAAARDRAAEREAKARTILERALATGGDARERLLVRVIEDAPWSPSAFEAYEALPGDE